MTIQLTTRGHQNQAVPFDASFTNCHLRICRADEEAELHVYSAIEIYLIMKSLIQQFGEAYFPLANNVELLGHHTEQPGLGMTIAQVSVIHNIAHAQGASYLGPCLEHLGYCEWNGEHHGIMWKIISPDISDVRLLNDLSAKFAP